MRSTLARKGWWNDGASGLSRARMRELSSSSHACSTCAAHRARHGSAREGTDRPGARRPARGLRRGHARQHGQQCPGSAGHGLRRRPRAGLRAAARPPRPRRSPHRRGLPPRADDQPTPSPDDDADDNEARVVTPAPVQDDDERDDDDDGDDTDDGDDDRRLSARAMSASGRRLARVSVRTRITVVIALLTAVAMAGAGLLVHALESARDRAAVTRPDHPGDRRVPRAAGATPTTGEPFDDVGRLLDVFLTRNVPDDDEMLVGYVEGARTIRTLNRYGQAFLDEPAYLPRPRRARRTTAGRRDPRLRDRSARSG